MIKTNLYAAFCEIFLIDRYKLLYMLKQSCTFDMGRVAAFDKQTLFQHLTTPYNQLRRTLSGKYDLEFICPLLRMTAAATMSIDILNYDSFFESMNYQHISHKRWLEW